MKPPADRTCQQTRTASGKNKPTDENSQQTESANRQNYPADRTSQNYPAQISQSQPATEQARASQQSVTSQKTEPANVGIRAQAGLQ
jgi:hypothetical protein